MTGTTLERPRRVAQLIPTNGLGGVETAARTMEQKIDLHIDFRLFPITGKALDGASRSGGSQRSLANPIAHVRAFIDLLRYNPDVIITSLWPCVLVASAFKFVKPKAKLVCFLHAEAAKGTVDRLAHIWLMRISDATWADSQATLAARVRHDRQDDCVVISFVVDQPERRLAFCPQPTPTFVSWGRIAHQKGLDRSLRLIHQLSNMGIVPKFDVWGPDGGERVALEARCTELSISNLVNFHGPIDRARLSEIARSASFFLQLSRFEGMAMAVVEGMQFGLVPIVTPVGQISTYCQANENAIVVDVDALGEAVDAIIFLLRHPEHFRSMARAAQATWTDTRLYADDVSAAALALCCGQTHSKSPNNT